jgi:hypothetical protein
MRADILIGWSILFAPAGLLLGAVIMFGGIPLYYRLRRVPRELRKIRFFARAGLTVLFAVCFTAVLCAISIYNIESSSNDYWQSQVGWDSWRMPLDEPYELYMINSMESASIRRWQASNPIISDVIRFEKRGPLVAGETGISRSKTDKTVLGWFLFNGSSGQCTTFASFEDFSRACAAAGFSAPLHARSVKEQWYLYWGIVKE